MSLKEDFEQLKKEVEELRRNRLRDLTLEEEDIIKGAVFQRTAATLASGASLHQYVILTLNGQRVAIPTYNKFSPLP